jgi:hypothetical protein
MARSAVVAAGAAPRLERARPGEAGVRVLAEPERPCEAAVAALMARLGEAAVQVRAERARRCEAAVPRVWTRPGEADAGARVSAPGVAARKPARSAAVPAEAQASAPRVAMSGRAAAAKPAARSAAAFRRAERPQGRPVITDRGSLRTITTLNAFLATMTRTSRLRLNKTTRSAPHVLQQCEPICGGFRFMEPAV